MAWKVVRNRTPEPPEHVFRGRARDYTDITEEGEPEVVEEMGTGECVRDVRHGRSDVQLVHEKEGVPPPPFDPQCGRTNEDDGCRFKETDTSSPLRNCHHDQLLLWRWHSLLGDDCDWNKQMRNGNVGRNPREPHR